MISFFFLSIYHVTNNNNKKICRVCYGIGIFFNRELTEFALISCLAFFGNDFFNKF